MLVLVVARTVNRLAAFSLPFSALVLVQQYGAPVSVAGLVLAGFGLATIPSRLAGGRLADVIGRRSTIVLGLTGCAAAQLAFAAAPGLGGAAVAVVALGLVFELYEPPSQALVADLCPEAGQPAAFALLGSALAAAGVLAGLLAAWLGHLDLRLLLVADAVSCLLGAALVRWGLPADRPSADPSSGAPSGSSSGPATVRSSGPGPWGDRRLLAMLAAGTAFATLYLQISVGLPLTLVARGLPADRLGLLLTVSAATIVAGQPVLRRLPAPRDGFAAMALGHLLLAAGLALTAVAHHLPTFVAATVVWSAGDLLLLGHPYAVVSRLAPAGATGRYLAAYGVSWGLAAIVAPLLGTQLIARSGPAALWLTGAAIALALAAAQPALRRACQPLLPVDGRCNG